MSAQFPGAVKTFTTKNAGDVIQPVDINDLQDEVNAIEDGYVNGTARLNSSNSTLRALSVTGGSTLTGLQVNGNSTLGSTVTFGTIGYIFPASAPASSGLALIVTSTGTPNTLGWGSPAATAQVMTLLKAGSGTQGAGAATVDSVAISGLTALDTILVYATYGATTADGNGFFLQNTTDTVNPTTTIALVQPNTYMATYLLKQRQTGNTKIITIQTQTSSVPAASFAQVNTTFVTAWTGSWTLGLKTTGGVAGTVQDWSWAVYKVAGQ